jgi:hypothetical protein
MTANDIDAIDPATHFSPQALMQRGRRLKASVFEAGAQARDRIEPAVSKTAELATMQAAVAGRQVMRRVRRSPVSTALAVAGVGAGLFLLLNGRWRTLALGAAMDLWRSHGEDLTKRVAAAVNQRI